MLAIFKSPYCPNLPGMECTNEKSHRQALCVGSQAWPRGVLIRGGSVRDHARVESRDGPCWAWCGLFLEVSDGNHLLSSMVRAGTLSPLRSQVTMNSNPILFFLWNRHSQPGPSPWVPCVISGAPGTFTAQLDLLNTGPRLSLSLEPCLEPSEAVLTPRWLWILVSDMSWTPCASKMAW